MSIKLSPRQSLEKPIFQEYSNITLKTQNIHTVGRNSELKIHDKFSTERALALMKPYSMFIHKFIDSYNSLSPLQFSERINEVAEKTNNWDVKKASVVSLNLITQGNNYIGTIMFVAGKLLNPDLVPPAPRKIERNSENEITINGRLLREFTAPQDI